ncbi:excisionase [Methylobacterium sp. B4]|uniref:excisionase n=1 Tax=Methylobacterium sp. B4 TaxID=1938755 RepID=UPI0011B766F7|nr:excisionase [Methylobacterium sp. B4]
MRGASMTGAPEITRTTPLRLAKAGALAFPDGGMMASSLRRAHDRGRRVTEFVTGKEHATLNAIDRVRKRCRAQPKAPPRPRRCPPQRRGPHRHRRAIGQPVARV